MDVGFYIKCAIWSNWYLWYILTLELSDSMACPIILPTTWPPNSSLTLGGLASGKALVRLNHGCWDSEERFYQEVHQPSLETGTVEGRRIFIWNVFTR